MKVFSVSMVRNEADIIETFVRYHCAIVDAMVIVDHASIDGTSKILASLLEEGLPLHLSAESGAAHDQSRVVTRAAREAASTHGADLVVFLDADEFLISSGGSDVRDVVGALAGSREGYFRVPWVTYVPTLADSAAEPNVLRRIQHRRKHEPRQFHKAMIPGSLMRRRTAVVSYGSHGLNKFGWIWHRRHPFVTAAGLGIAHFPVRSNDQLLQKVLVGWPAHLARADKKSRENSHWELLYQQMRCGWVPTTDELTALAMTYAAGDDPEAAGSTELVHDPISPAGPWFDLRYTQAETVSLLMCLTAAMEQQARSLANLGTRIRH